MEQFEKPNQLTAGQMLVAARERLQLSQLDIAKALRLKVKSVMELEADDYHEFRAAVYVKGYLRRYAEIVQLDETAVLAKFNPVGFKVNAISHNEKMSGPIKIQKAPILSKEKSISGIIIVVVLVAVVIGINWYKHDKSSDLAKAAQTAAPVAQLETLAPSTATDLTNSPNDASAPAADAQNQAQNSARDDSQAQTRTNDDDTAPAEIQPQAQTNDDSAAAQAPAQTNDETVPAPVQTQAQPSGDTSQ